MRGTIGSLAMLAGLLVAGGATRTDAQGWTATFRDEGGYAFAYLSPFPGLRLGCHPRSRQERDLVALDEHEIQKMAPFTFRLELATSLVPLDGGATRGDLVFWTGETGHRLPPISYSDWDGAFQLDLPMTDPLWAALQTAPSLVLAVGQEAAWQIPVMGLGDGIARAFAACIDTLAATGHAVPPALAAFAPEPLPTPTPSPGSVPQVVRDDISRKCAGRIDTIPPDAVTFSDIDGDGAADIVVNYQSIRCAGAMARPMCGAANCSIDFFLTRRGFADPVRSLGVGVELQPRTDAPGQEVVVTGSFSLCGPTSRCPPLVWNGRDLAAR